MYSCATCGKNINRGGLCNACWKQWTFTGTYPTQGITWLNELIKIQRRYERIKASSELSFSVAGIDDDYLYDREMELTDDEIVEY